MRSLSGRELSATYRFLEVGYEATARAGVQGSAPIGALPRPVLQALATLVPADFVESFQIPRALVPDTPYTTDHDDPHPILDFDELAPVLAQNPIGAFKWKPADGPIRLSGLMSARTLRSLPWHRDYLRPMRIRDQLKVWLWTSPDAAACVSLDRADADFDDRDLAVLAVLQQHLAAMRESLMLGSSGDSSNAGDAGRLSVREAQVLTWAARGRRNHEIAELLFISTATVRKHLEHAYAKLGVRNRSEAVAAMRERDLVDPSADRSADGGELP